MTAQQPELTNGWKYTLTGFGEFLEMRRVAFAEPMPPTRLCGVCGVLPRRTLLLPCNHIAEHLTQCGGGKIKCCKCNRPVFRNHAVNHYRSCTGLQHAATAGAAAKGDKMADIEKSTRELMLRQGRRTGGRAKPLHEHFGRQAMVDHRVVRKPRAGVERWGHWTIKKNWQDIELKGYVDRGALYVNVEFE
ncbi:hypothetical protein HPB52_021003 [Rhipicephalus sanguineus]|uniref:Uncharacterized protein n=1 Tax=Rhipicephalus sanguineus TaxID=34632 RepID=A0A9D4T6R5_RHISA|nr:hypothetical protein HPB52_021003 [Rhipicephalus sanguineus]